MGSLSKVPRRGFVFALCLVAALAAAPVRARAAGYIEGRVGLAAPLHGDTQDDLNLDLGFGGGASLGLELMELLSVDLRYDALLLFGDVFDGTDTTSVTHAVSLGPQLTFRQDPVVIYVGVHPGVYFTQLSLDGTLTLRPPLGTRDVSVDSDYSVDFGFNAEIGVHWFLTEGLYLGPEVAYHLVLLEDDHLGFDVEGTEFEGGKIDDEVGTLTAAFVFGWRF